jgi:hypothetical protein
MLDIHSFLICAPLMMGFYFTFGSFLRDSWFVQSTEWHTPSRIRRHAMKIAVMIVFGLVDIIVAVCMDIKGSEALSDALLMLLPLGFVAGIFVKFRNFSWWRNCRISRWFY